MASRTEPKSARGSETASAVKDTAGGLAGKTQAAVTTSIEAFGNHAMVAVLYEIEAENIALRRSTRQDVRHFAQVMLKDFGKMKSELGALLGATESPTQPPDSVDRMHKVLLDDLNGAADADFDKRYISQQQLAHSEAITLFKTYRDHGANPGLQNLCRLALPILEQHAELARRLAAA